MKEISEKIKNDLSIEQIKDLLETLRAEPEIHGNYIIARTVCHGGDRHKLYYYDNTKLFKCYTECNSSFDIYELIIKTKKVENIEISLIQAIKYIINFFNLPIDLNNETSTENDLSDWNILNKYIDNNNLEQEEKIVELKFYDNNILKYLPHLKLTPWLNEGISQEVIDNCNITFDPFSYGIVIPHYNIDNKLIGIRERTLIREEEDNGKYKPAILNYKMYNHPLGFNLYNLNNSKDNIRKIKKVIVFEGEKSCLLFQSYFGINADISVAVCGSNLTQYQFDLLKSLDIEEIIIAFDKQFKEIGDIEWKRWTEKLKDINKKYSGFIHISYMFDKENLLRYKSSPIDEGKEKFLELFEKRVSL